ncbi:MAG: hypothetical protein J2P17_01475 [Mycobacterium sp.]|nr:hypothetical protein [Mycobacterium sp.]
MTTGSAVFTRRKNSGLLTYQTSHVLAGRLEAIPVGFPGNHGGFLEHPSKFADILRKVFAD